MTTRLNQLIAIKKTVSADASRVVTDQYHTLQRTAALNGIRKSYLPKDDEGEKLPGEYQRVTTIVPNVLDDVEKALVRLFDTTGSIDRTNQLASAPVVLNGNRLTPDLPVATLLFLEKQLTDLATIIGKLPLLDPSEVWTESDETGVYQSAPIQTHRSKKIPRNHVKAKATDKHPEQVEVYYEDAVVGTWTTVKFSGAIRLQEARDMLAKVRKLIGAVKQAREAANMTEVTDVAFGQTLLNYILRG